MIFFQGEYPAVKKLVYICIFIWAVTGVEVCAQEQQQAYINTDTEHLLVSPGGVKLGQLSGKTVVVVIETQGEWVRVATTGWVRKQSLTSITPDGQKVYIQASHILVSTEAEARDILAKLKAGSDFAELARQYSIDEASRADGGDLGVFAKGDLLPVFDDAAFKLKPGEFSGIVKSDLGYHIIKRTR